MYFIPRVCALDENTIGLGQKIHYPRKGPKIDEEFHAVLNNAGQHLYLSAELGTSIDEIMASEEPMLKSLAKGFKVTHTQCLIGNMKKLLLELSKTEDETKKMFAMQALMVAPLTMLQMNANLNITFDDFEEIESHDMAQPFLATFNQLFEGPMGQPW